MEIIEFKLILQYFEIKICILCLKIQMSDLTSFQRGHSLAWAGRFSMLRFMEYLSWSPCITYMKKRKLFISCSALVLLSSGFLKLGIPPETNRSAFNFRRVVFFLENLLSSVVRVLLLLQILWCGFFFVHVLHTLEWFNDYFIFNGSEFWLYSRLTLELKLLALKTYKSINSKPEQPV